MIKNKDFWVFDLDGTLVNSFPFYLAIVKNILTRFEKTLSEDEVSVCLGQPAAKFFQYTLGDKLAEEALNELGTQSIADAEHIKPFPGVLSLLKNLKSQSKKIAVWTSRDLNSANLVLEKTGLNTYIDHCVSGCCVSVHKPNPEGLSKIAQFFSCEVSDMVVVGDHEYDVQAAKAAGAYGIRACWHGFDPPANCAYAQEVFRDVPSLSRRLELGSVHDV